MDHTTGPQSADERAGTVITDEEAAALLRASEVYRNVLIQITPDGDDVAESLIGKELAFHSRGRLLLTGKGQVLHEALAAAPDRRTFG